MSISKDKVAIGGMVRIVVKRADGRIEEIGEHHNDIDNSLKGKIATAIGVGGTFGISSTTLFGDDSFTTPPTDDESGIVAHTGSDKYEMQTTELAGGTAYKYKYQGILRSTSSLTITGAILGYKWATSVFTTTHATHSFSQALVDGDQLTITWEITLADA